MAHQEGQGWADAARKGKVSVTEIMKEYAEALQEVTYTRESLEVATKVVYEGRAIHKSGWEPWVYEAVDRYAEAQKRLLKAWEDLCRASGHVWGDEASGINAA